MQKTLFLITVCLIAVNAFAQKQIYNSPKLKEAIKTQKTVAILPFKVSINYKKLPKGFDSAANKNEELQYGTIIQSSLFTYLSSKVKNYTVTFQNIEKTDTLLAKSKMLDSLDSHTKDEIAKILGVDAVIFGTYSSTTTRSENEAVTTTLLFGPFTSKTGEGELTIQMANGSDGELLWRYSNKINEGLYALFDEVIERQMRKLSRNFPYSK